MNNARREKIQRVIFDLTEIKERVTKLRDEEESAFDNMPENLQDGLRGSTSQDAISCLEEAEDLLDEVLDNLQEATM